MGTGSKPPLSSSRQKPRGGTTGWGIGTWSIREAPLGAPDAHCSITWADTRAESHHRAPGSSHPTPPLGSSAPTATSPFPEPFPAGGSDTFPTSSLCIWASVGQQPCRRTWGFRQDLAGQAGSSATPITAIARLPWGPKPEPDLSALHLPSLPARDPPPLASPMGSHAQREAEQRQGTREPCCPMLCSSISPLLRWPVLGAQQGVGQEGHGHLPVPLGFHVLRFPAIFRAGLITAVG